MSITPYTPTTFVNPVVNPAIGGAGQSYPYVSVSQYRFAPTGVDTSNLVVGGSAAQSTQALADTLTRASSWADRITMGADAAAKGASLCATLSIESGMMPAVRGELRLVCDYKPIIQVNGVDIGPDMGSLASVGASAAGAIRIGRRTIYVPLTGTTVRPGTFGSPSGNTTGSGGRYACAWDGERGRGVPVNRGWPSVNPQRPRPRLRRPWPNRVPRPISRSC